MRRTKWGIVVLTAAGVVLLGAAVRVSGSSEIIIPDDPGGGGGGGGGPAYPAGKVETQVVDELNADGTTDFFIWMTASADLTPAASLQTKAEKGQFVYDALVQTANSSQASIRASLDSQGVAYEPLYIVNGILVRGGTMAAMADAANRSDVREITANHVFQADLPPTAGEPSATGIESSLLFIGADIVWNRGITGQGAVLAANDTGLDEDHPAIRSHYRGCVNPPTCSTEDHHYDWWDATGTYPNDPFDGQSHGTHVTGTMVGDDGGANRIGVAPGAKTIHCKNLDDGGFGSDAWILECFQWDLAPWDLNGANPRPDLAPDVVNNSWGYPFGGNPVFKQAVTNLQAAGVLVEASAGNEGGWGCSSLRSPGDYADVLTTGSVRHAGLSPPGTISGFSSRGPSVLDPGFFPDVMAPGESIRSTLPNGGYGLKTGTSMSGPHVSGLVGLLIASNPAIKGRVADIQAIIKDTAIPLSGQTGLNCGGNYVNGPNNDWGYGTIDAVAATDATRSTTCTIDLVGNASNCWMVGAVSFVVPPAGGRAVVKAALVPGSGVAGAYFDVTWGGAPSGWTVNIGDSQSNNGFGGDAIHQQNDAEMQVLNTTLSVYGSDKSPASVRNILNLNGAVSQGAMRTYEVRNEFLGFGTGDLRSQYLYALAGQPDSEGPVNYDVYAGFNRSIGTASRTGTGVTSVTIRLIPGQSSGGGGGSVVIIKEVE